MNFEVNAGLLSRGALRRFLKEAEWEHQVAEWTEIRSLLGSKFLIRGASAAVVEMVFEWCRATGQSQDSEAVKP